jgi:hypothetical protein
MAVHSWSLFWGAYSRSGLSQYGLDISKEWGELSKTVSINAETCESEKSQLRLTGATEKTRADTLSKQNLDQQNTINSCLTQAMKLLTQEPLIITKLPILQDLDHQGPGIHTVHLLVLTNKTIPTVRIKAECNHAISSGNGELIGGNMLSEGAVINPANVLHVSIDSPSWTPTRPLMINMTYTAPKDDLRCSIDQN